MDANGLVRLPVDGPVRIGFYDSESEGHDEGGVEWGSGREWRSKHDCPGLIHIDVDPKVSLVKSGAATTRPGEGRLRTAGDLRRHKEDVP